MKNLKNILMNLIIFGSLFGCLLPLTVNAQPLSPITGTADIIRALNNVKNLIWAIILVIVVIMFVWAGITFVTAEGNPNRIEQARNRVLYGIIGIIIALIAGGLITLINQIMG